MQNSDSISMVASVSETFQDMKSKFSILMMQIVRRLSGVDAKETKYLTDLIESIMDLDNITEHWLKKYCEFISLKPEVIHLDMETKRLSFSVIFHCIDKLPPDIVALCFLNYYDRWIFEPNARAFILKISALFGTVFPPDAVIDMIQSSELGVRGMGSRYEDVLSNLLTYKFVPLHVVDESLIIGCQFLKRLDELRFNIISEDNFALEIFVSIISAGSVTIRDAVAKKISVLLSNPRLVKVISQLIAVLMYNIDFDGNDLDIQCAYTLFNLKIKAPLQALLDSIIKYLLLEQPRKIYPFLNLLLSQSPSPFGSLISRTVSITHHLIEWHHDHMISVFDLLWSQNNDNYLVYISNVLKTTKYSQCATKFFDAILNFNDMNTLYLPNFFIYSSRTIGYIFIEQYYTTMVDNRNLPSSIEQLPPSAFYAVDQSLTELFHRVRLLYLTCMAKYLHSLPTISDSIALTIYEGIRNILIIQPLSYYLPESHPAAFERNYNVVKSQLTLSLLYEQFNITVKIMEVLIRFSEAFVHSINEFLEILICVFDFILNLDGHIEPKVFAFAISLLQNNFIENILSLCSFSSNIITDTKFDKLNLGNISPRLLIKHKSFIYLLEIYAKLFLMDIRDMGPLIFEKYICIKYAILSFIIPNFDAKRYLAFENSSLVKTISLKLTQSDVSPTECLLVDITRDIFNISADKRYIDLKTRFPLLKLLFDDYPFLNTYIERLWKFYILDPSSTISSVFSHFAFIPSMLNQCKPPAQLHKLPNICLVIYFCLDFFKTFFREDIPLNRNLIDYLFNIDFRPDVSCYLHDIFESDSFSICALLLFFICTSKVKCGDDYIRDTFYLESYIYEEKYGYLKEKIISSIERAFLNALSTDILSINLKFMVLVPSTSYFSILIKWIPLNYRKAIFLVNDDYNTFNLICENLIKYFPSNLSIDEVYSIELFLTLINDFQHPAYLQLFGLLQQNGNFVHYNPVYFTLNFAFSNIIKSSNIKLVIFFLEHIKFNNDLSSIDFFVKLLEISQYTDSSFILVSERCLELLESTGIDQTCHNFEDWRKIINQIFIATEISLNVDDFKKIAAMFGLDSPNLPQNDSSCVQKISINTILNMDAKSDIESPRLHHDFKEVILDGHCLGWEDDTSILKDVNSFPIDGTPGTEISKNLEKQVNADPMAALSFIRSKKCNVNNYLSYQNLSDFIRRLSDSYDQNFAKYSSEILKIITDLFFHPQLFISQRQVSISYDLIKDHLPHDSKFAIMLCNCLISEVLHCDLECLTTKIDEKLVFWAFFSKNLVIKQIENIFYKYSYTETKFVDLAPSNQIIMVFLNLNNPNLFYDKIYECYDFDVLKQVCSRIKQTISDEYIMKMIKNSFECIISDDFPIRSSLRFLNFCKILKLYPLLIIKHFSYFLSCLLIGLKTALFSTTWSKMKQQSLFIIREILRFIDQQNFKPHDKFQIDKLSKVFESVASKENIHEVNIDTQKIDLFIMSLNDNLPNDTYINFETSTSEIGYWLITHHVQKIPELRNQLSSLGCHLHTIINKSESNVPLVKFFLPFLVVVPHFWQSKIIETILFKKSNAHDDDVLDYIKKNQDIFAAFEDIFDLYCY